MKKTEGLMTKGQLDGDSEIHEPTYTLPRQQSGESHDTIAFHDLEAHDKARETFDLACDLLSQVAE